MDLTRTDIDSMDDDEFKAFILGNKEVAAAIELSRHIRMRAKQDADTIARRERRVVLRERVVHTDEGPASVREFIGRKECGTLFVTDVGHEAVALNDFSDAHALAAQAQRDIGQGFWRAVATRELASPSWIRLTDSRATMGL